MEERPIFEEVMSSQVEVLEAEQRLHRLEAQLGEDPTEAQLAAAGRARDAYEALGGYTIEAKVRSVLFGLGFKEADLARATSEFSGGWQMRIALAKLLIRNPEVLLLDEPTNHLDLESVKWLEGFLRGYAGTVVVVSHDRAFMDNMVDRVAEIDNGQVNLYKGNYTAYLQAREERLEQPARRSGQAGRGNSPHGGLRREVPLQAHQGQAGAGPREEAGEDPAHPAARREEDRALQLQAAAPHGRDRGQGARPGEALRRQGRLRRTGLHAVPRRQGGAGGPQRRGQVDAAEDGGRRAGSRCGRHRVRRARDEDLLRPASAGRAASGQHRVRGAGPRGAGLDHQPGAHAAGRVSCSRATRWTRR